MKIKYVHCVALLATAALLFPLAALARSNSRSVDISSAVQIGTTQLKPGSYKVEWQGSGPVVQVSFEQNGKTLVTVSATLKAAKNQVTQDAVTMDNANANISTLKEIDFSRQKESLVFDQTGGM
jgi:hypothetical protein